MIVLRLLLGFRRYWSISKTIAVWMRLRTGSVKRWWLEYLKNWALGLDCWINTWFAGSYQQTLSSRFYRLWQNRDCAHCRMIGYLACRVLHWIDKDHCAKAWDNKPVAKDLTNK
jgi:hypothetical protein